VSIIEKLGRILTEKLDKRASAIVSGLLKQADITIITNQQDYEIERVGGAVRSVRLASAGSSTRTHCCRRRHETEHRSIPEYGLAINKGIVIHESLQTSDPMSTPREMWWNIATF